jgi:hypothetical protein
MRDSEISIRLRIAIGNYTYTLILLAKNAFYLITKVGFQQ